MIFPWYGRIWVWWNPYPGTLELIYLYRVIAHLNTSSRLQCEMQQVLNARQCLEFIRWWSRKQTRSRNENLQLVYRFAATIWTGNCNKMPKIHNLICFLVSLALMDVGSLRDAWRFGFWFGPHWLARPINTLGL